MLTVAYAIVEGTSCICQEALWFARQCPVSELHCALREKAHLHPPDTYIRSPKAVMPFVSAFILHKTFRRYTTFDNSILFMIEPWSMRNQHAFQLCEVQSGRY